MSGHRSKAFKDKIGQAVDKFLEMIEKDRFTIITATFYLLVLGIIRSFLESQIFEYRNFSLYLAAQHTMFNIPVLLFGVIGISLFGNIRPKKSFNVALFGFSIVLLPPIIDYLFFGLSGSENAWRYEYIPLPSYISVILGKVRDVSSPGMLTLYISLLCLTGAYVSLRTRSIIRGIATSMFIACVIIFIGGLLSILVYHIGDISEDSYITLFSIFRQEVSPQYYEFLCRPEIGPYIGNGQIYSPYMGRLLVQQRSITMICYFLILSITFVYVLARLYYKRLFDHLISKIDFRMLFIAGATVIGIASVRSIDSSYSNGLALNFYFIPHTSYIFLTIFAICCAWMSITLRRELDESTGNKQWHVKNVATKYQYAQISLAFAALALILTFVLGWIPFILLICFLVIGRYAYKTVSTSKRLSAGKKKSSLRPYSSGDTKQHMRKIFPILILISFLIGIYSPSMWLIKASYLRGINPIIGTTMVELDWDHSQIIDKTVQRTPIPSLEMVMLGIILTIGTFAWVSMYVKRIEGKRLIKGKEVE